MLRSQSECVVSPSVMRAIMGLVGGLVCAAGPSAAPLVCQVVPGGTLVRGSGKTEQVADLMLYCTGGTPTAAGAVVPAVNISLFLNTNVTSRTDGSPSFINMLETLLLVDEPNSLIPPPQRPLLNCGQAGAPDTGPSGPGVCQVTSTGDPTKTYDGTPFYKGTSYCGSVTSNVPAPSAVYGCGRPNVFQARLGTGSGTGPTLTDVITFEGVPLDPPGNGERIFRITNLRGNANLLGSGHIQALVTISGPISVQLENQIASVAVVFPDLSASSPANGVIQVKEGASNFWKARNVSFFVGNTPTPGNATYSVPNWTYTPGALNYPAEVAQNVPGVIYRTEDGFTWSNDTTNAPPSPNPPSSFGTGPVSDLGLPLKSNYTFTGINQAGETTQGTRVALSFSNISPAGATPVCLTTVPIFAGATQTGVFSMTTTDANGSGAYTAVSGGVGISHTNLAVYEALMADVYQLEMSNIPCQLRSGGTPVAGSATVTIGYAPFFTTPGSGQSTGTPTNPTPLDLPRFAPGTVTVTVTFTKPPA
jgi:hypothetical protein